MKPAKHFRFPSAAAILVVMIFFVTALTYIVPGGEFITQTDPETGLEITSLEHFVYKEAEPVSFLEIPLQIVSAFSTGSTAMIVLTYFFMGGSIYVMTGTGAFQALIGWCIKRLNGNRLVMVMGFTGAFALFNIILSPHAFLAFVPFSIMLARTIGYDDITGVAMPLLGGAISFSTGALAATTMTAQTIVGLPIYSGAVYRFVCMVLLLIPTTLYIYRYGEKIRIHAATVESAPGAQEDGLSSGADFNREIEPRHLLTLILFLAAISLVVYGAMHYNWGNLHVSAVFMVFGFGIGLLWGNSFEKVFHLYLTGAGNMMGSAVLAGLAGAATSILTSGGIIYTVVYHASKIILCFPPVLYAPVMFLMHLLINCAIVSGGGQAAAAMPIMGPVAQFCGIPLQSAVLTFNLGDGLGNYILPHSNQLVTYLEAGKVSYWQWMRFMGKLFVIWVVMAMLLCGFSVLVWR